MRKVDFRSRSLSAADLRAYAFEWETEKTYFRMENLTPPEQNETNLQKRCCPI